MNSQVILAAVLLSFLLSACSHQSVSRVNSDANTYSSISVAMPDFKPQQGQSFAWYSSPLWSSDVMASEYPGLQNLLQQSINNELLSKGYKITQDKTQASYIIGVALITQGGDRNASMNDFFNIFPGLPKSAAGFDKGVIAVGVVDASRQSSADTTPSSNDLLWRSALEAFILENVNDTQQQTARVAQLTTVLLQRFP